MYVKIASNKKCTHLLFSEQKIIPSLIRKGSLLINVFWKVSHNLTASNKDFSCHPYFLFFLFFCLFAISWAAPTAYGGSQASGLMELWLPAYTRATAMQDPSHVCDLHHSSRQRRILNPLSKGRDRTCNLMVPSRIR